MDFKKMGEVCYTLGSISIKISFISIIINFFLFAMTVQGLLYIGIIGILFAVIFYTTSLITVFFSDLSTI